MQRFFICAGGTGGHIFPGLSIAEELKKNGRFEIHFIGTRRGMEKKLITQNGYPLHCIRARGWDRTFSLFFFQMLFDNFIGLFQAFWLVSTQRPCGVLAMGSYVSLLVAIWSRLFRIPLFVHEQNVLPGLANRIVARWSRKIFISAEDSLAYFQNQDTILLTGNPLRKSVMEWKGKKDKARALFGLDPLKATVLVIGGSLGSSFINQVFFDMRLTWKGEDFQVIHITGTEDYQWYQQSSLEIPGRYLVFDFLPEPGAAYAAADCVVCRAGANTTFELCWFQLPAIMIPFEGATESHQTLNACWLRKKQPVEMIRELEFNPEILAKVLERMISLQRETATESKCPAEAASLIATTVIGELQRRN